MLICLTHSIFAPQIDDMFKIFILCLGLLAVAMALLSINILLKKNGHFRSLHIGQSRAMRERGIHCAQAQDFEARLHNPMAVEEKKH